MGNPLKLRGRMLVAVAGFGRSSGVLGDTDPLNKAPFERARSRVKKGPL